MDMVGLPGPALLDARRPRPSKRVDPCKLLRDNHGRQTSGRGPQKGSEPDKPMRKATAQRISTYLSERTSEGSPGFSIERLQEGRPLDGFHQWVDGKQLLSADRIRRDEDGTVILCLLIEWRPTEEWYAVVFDQARHAPLAEIGRELQVDDIISLEWQYKPAKQDGRNPERVAYFRNHVGDRTLQISVPDPGERSLRFVEDLFGLVENRLKADELSADEPEVRESFPEGEAFERSHLSRERNSALIRLVKARAIKCGALACQVCNFDFHERYGAVGHGYIEAHHTVPVKDLRKGSQTRVEDIALVCANCHRMLHRRRPWLKMEGIRAVLKANSPD